ncbi:MAG: hypothetical protein HYZ27_11305, partial [Deltaproteobacteria bacterium]|nr:hypothetical protein [Deltaproteobacteria bacterium]
MALDLRLQQKMVQQLVMTPQLQQAIKLLQLSHLEMAEVLQAEMEQNPVLEEPGEGDDDEPNAGDNETDASASPVDSDANGDGTEGDGSGDMPAGEVAPPSVEAGPKEAEVIVRDMTTVLDEGAAGATPEPTTGEVDREIDWEAYLETYSYSLPATAGRATDDELPPLEASMSKPTSLHDHLRWQVQMGDFSQDEARIAAVLIEEINDDGYLAEDAAETVAQELEVSVEEVETVIGDMQSFDPAGVAARNLRECLLIQVRGLAHE